jgi:hypothetical protein
MVWRWGQAIRARRIALTLDRPLTDPDGIRDASRRLVRTLGSSSSSMPLYKRRPNSIDDGA